MKRIIMVLSILGFSVISLPNAAFAASPTVQASVRCGHMFPESSGDLTFYYGNGTGFMPGSTVSYSLQPENLSLGGITASAGGSIGGTELSGSYGEVFIANTTSVQDGTITPGPHAVKYSSNATPDVAASFNVPTSCPAINLDVTPALPNNRVLRYLPFQVAILSTNNFNAPSRIDTASLKAYAPIETLPLALSCTTSRDVNGDGRPDVVCSVRVTQSAAQLPANTDTYLRITGRTTDEGSSAAGFLFVTTSTFNLLF